MKDGQSKMSQFRFIILSVVYLMTCFENIMAEEESPLFMDLRIKEILYNSPKRGSFHDGPIGKVQFDSVQMSRGDIDVIDLKKENIRVLDSKIFLKNNPKREQYTLFGKPLGSKARGTSQALGLSLINSMARFKILLKKDSPLENLRIVSAKDLSLRLNPNCPQVKGPDLQLKTDEMDLSVTNLDLKCPLESRMSKKLSDDILLKCLNRAILSPLSFSVPKKMPQYPGSLCNNNLKNKPYLEGQKGSDPKTVDISVHVRPKVGEEKPKEIELTAKVNSVHLTPQGFIEADIEQVSMNFLELDPRNPKAVKTNMSVKVPSGKIKCKKNLIKNPKFKAKNLVDDCLNGLNITEMGAISVKDNLKGTFFKISPSKIRVDENLTFFAKEICIADAKKVIAIKDIRMKCGKDKKQVFTELPKTISSCLKKGHFVIHNVNSIEGGNPPTCDLKSSSSGSSGPIRNKSDLKNILSKVKFFNPFSSSKKGRKENRNEKKYLSGIGITIDNNKLVLGATLLLSKIETHITLEGRLDFKEKEKIMSLKLTKAELPFGIKSTKLTAWLIKSFVANEKVWVDKDEKIFMKL